MKVSRAGYYAWRNRKVSNHDVQGLFLSAEVAQIYAESRNTYGVPRILVILERKGINTSRRRFERLMREIGIKSVSKHAGKQSHRKTFARERR